MSLTLGLTGMDPGTEVSLKAAFGEANAQLGGQWQLVPEQQAAYVMVDMDSMYGPMSWLRLHAAEKTVIGLTSAPRTQTDFRLERPFNVTSVGTLLREIASAAGPAFAVPAPAMPAPAAVPSPPVERVVPMTASPAPSPTPTMAEAAAPAAPFIPAAIAPAAPSVAEAAVNPASEPEPATSASIPQAWLSDAPAEPEPTPTPVSSKPTNLASWLQSGQLKGRTRVRGITTSLLLDLDGQHYHGPAGLKPLADLFGGFLEPSQFEPVADAAWAHDSAAAGAAQPLSRLVWFGALIGGKGVLAHGYDPADRFRLTKWPQTEREYPKHFRIATVMMKGPATLTEVAETSGVPLPEVIDFVNASLATGFAEPYREPEPEPEQSKSAGLFGRLRGGR